MREYKKVSVCHESGNVTNSCALIQAIMYTALHAAIEISNRTTSGTGHDMTETVQAIINIFRVWATMCTCDESAHPNRYYIEL